MHFIKEDLAKVGTGVYRSARQNALRLTITETNMAYNYANCKRWSDEPFVLGIRIRLSGNHPQEDICDELAGDYPKDFMWRGWHPRCRCSMSSILMDRDSEEWKKLRAMSDEDYKKYQSPNLVKEMPKKFKTWCDTNKDKLNTARERGKLPYFVRDNEKVVWNIIEQKIKFKEDSFYSDNKFGERLRINKNADKTEIIENIRCARSILSSFNDVNITIREHLLEVGKKNPEYEINGYIADRKGIESPNGISASFNKAIKQGCSIVVIDLDMHKDKFKQLPSIKLSSAINNRYSDFKKDIIKELCCV